MKRSLATFSLLLLGISVIFLTAWTVFESAFMGMSATAERIVTFALLVLPAGTGAFLGLLSLIQKEGKAGLAVAGIVLNTLFALFHLMIVLLAG